MRVVVLGGSGFLGSHVADALTGAGHDVVVYDNRESPYLLPEQTMVVGDILDEELLDRAVEGSEAVYNYAGIADIDECAIRPVDTARLNVVGNCVALEAARKAGVKRFVFASSVYVYSESGAVYRSSKQASELFTEDYQTLFGLPYTIVRYGSLYGERAGEWNSIRRFIRQGLETGEIVYHGTGDETREWIHVRDAARLSVDILEPEYENQRVIITGNQSMRYRDFLEMIREILGNKVTVVYQPSTRGAHYKITPYLFSPKMGYKLVSNPHIDLGQGLLACIADIHKELHQEQHEEMGLLVEKDIEESTS
jgi:UDP-glucose 4-epimerase